MINIDTLLKENTRANYNTYCDIWNFYLQSYLGGEDYINSKNLRKHIFEDQSEYAYRMKFAYYDNQCKYVINKYTTHIYSVPPERKGIDGLNIEYFLNNVNSTDNPNIFFRHVLGLLLTLGELFIIIDYPAVEVDELNDEVIINNNLNHTVEVLLPQYMPVFDPVNRIATIIMGPDEYKIWTDTEVFYYKNSKLVLEKSHPHSFGTIPIIYAMLDTNNDNIGESLLRDIARVNRAKFNMDNSRNEDLFNAPWSTMTLPLSDELMRFYQETGQVNPLNNKLEVPRGKFMFVSSEGKPEILESNPQFITANREESQYLTEQIQRMANQKISEMALNQSGISKAYDLDNQNTALEFVAESMEALEYQFYGLFWEIAYQQQMPDTVSITYNTHFDLYDYGQRLDKMQEIADNSQYPSTARNIAKMTLLKEVLPLSIDDEEVIQKELNAMGAVSTVENMGKVETVIDQSTVNPYQYRKYDNKSYNKPKYKKNNKNYTSTRGDNYGNVR